MNRIAILAAAAALIALPASAQSVSAQSIRVSTGGKSAEQVRTEVDRAAYTLCFRDVPGAAWRTEVVRSCQAATVRATLAQSSDPSLRVASR